MPGWVDPAALVVDAGPANGNQIHTRISLASASATIMRLAPMPEEISVNVVMTRDEGLGGGGGGASEDDEGDEEED
jgi:hypothetical protein